MFRLKKSLCLFVFILIPKLIISTDQTQQIKNRMMSDLDFIKNTFFVYYAPVEWKRNYAGWDLDREIAIGKEKIQNAAGPDLKTYQRAVRDFMNSTKDYHVGVVFYSTEAASLPFRVKGANGRYFISFINRKKLSSAVYPFRVGDELIMFDGKNTDQVVENLKNNELTCDNQETDTALAEIFLTQRVGSLGHIVPKGPVTIKVNSSGKISSYQLIWNYKPELISNSVRSLVSTTGTSIQKGGTKALRLADHPFFRKKMLFPLYEDILLKMVRKEESGDLPGSRQSFIPTLGKVWWMSSPDNPFHAYLFENEEGKLIGYIRIPHYLGSDEEAGQFEQIVSFFKERSEALVIDQVNNPGGMIFYMYALASMLTENPLSNPRHKMKITQSDVSFALQVLPMFEQIESDNDAKAILGETFHGNPVTYQMAQFFVNYFHFIIDEWNAGRSFTNPYYLYSIDHINPHPRTRYNKPILLLTNGLDFSCADFFPAILQDNKRVTILGTRTAGAGGYVLGTEFPNLFGIAYFHYTGSIAERVNSRTIENNGVTPDIEYNVTVDDLQNGYKGYVQALQEAIRNLLVIPSSG